MPNLKELLDNIRQPLNKPEQNYKDVNFSLNQAYQDTVNDINAQYRYNETMKLISRKLSNLPEE